MSQDESGHVNFRQFMEGNSLTVATNRPLSFRKEKKRVRVSLVVGRVFETQERKKASASEPDIRLGHLPFELLP